MNTEFVGQFMAFKGSDEYAPERNILVEVTDTHAGGIVEIAFNAPIPGNPRIYLKLDLAEIIKRAVGDPK